MGYTPDERPIIGPLRGKTPEEETQFIIAGFSGK
jgi:hypothetical protein